jgi:hypothetical protein
MTNACAMFPMYQTPFSVTALSSSGITSSRTFQQAPRSASARQARLRTPISPHDGNLGVDFERRNGGWSDLGGQLQDGLLDVIAFRCRRAGSGGDRSSKFRPT